MKNFTLNTWNSKNTVFTINELSQIIPHSSDKTLRLKISNYKKRWYIEKITRWIYSIPNIKINSFELANKIYSPSYISFFSALYHHGIIFQANPSQIDLAYKKSQIVKLKNLWLEIKLRCLKEDILLNPEWLLIQDTYTIASPERAFLDTIYLYKNIYFDNIDWLNLDKIKELFPLYKKDKMMKNRILKYFPNINLWMQQ
jgi:hypothetical protein